ncbi:MAG: hypothetical protein ACHP79_15010, partial [Terriglobales bacterium]
MTKNQNREILCRLLCGLVCLVALGGQARAQSLGLAPAQVVEKFKPGVPFQFDLSTVNSGDTPVDMHVEITDFWYDEKNEKVFSSPGTSPRSAANWIQFVPDHFEVGPHGTQKMKAIVTPPGDAKGGYYAVLFVQSKPQLSFPKEDGKGVFTSMRIGCLVLLRAEATEDYKIEVSNVKVTPPAEARGLSVDFDLLNSSNTHVFPVARVAVLDASRKLVAKAESDEKRFLPGQKNAMHVEWAGTLPPGNYTA